MKNAVAQKDLLAAQSELQRIVAEGDPLSPLDRAILGNSAARVHIPLRDPVDLRRCSIILSDLANKLMVCSHMKGDARTPLFAARMHITEAAGKLRSRLRSSSRS